MGRYDVVAPCAFMVDGRAVHHTRPGAVVEIGDDQAASLVAGGQLARRPLPPPAPESGQTVDDTAATQVPSRRRQPRD